jgi:hypothetical protein
VIAAQVAGIIGYFNDRWTLGEAAAAVQARREDEWSRIGFALCWVVNSMPNFSKTRRTMQPIHKFNPYLKARQHPATDKAKDAGFDALWESLPEAPQ